MTPGRPTATEPSPFQRELIVLALTDVNATKDSLSKAMGCNHGVIRYQLQALRAKRWLPLYVLDGINERSLKHGPKRPPAMPGPGNHQVKPMGWADKIVWLLRNDLGAVERFARMFEGGAL